LRLFNTPCLIALVAIAALYLAGCAADQPVSDGNIPVDLITYRIVPYGNTYTAKNPCGGTTLIVKPGQFVVWQNTTDVDQKITFDDKDKLIFGEESVVIPPNGWILLQVKEDLDGHPTHQYLFSIGDKPVGEFRQGVEVETTTIEAVPVDDATEIPVGPPGIIVCPPDQTCG